MAKETKLIPLLGEEQLARLGATHMIVIEAGKGGQLDDPVGNTAGATIEIEFYIPSETALGAVYSQCERPFLDENDPSFNSVGVSLTSPEAGGDLIEAQEVAGGSTGFQRTKWASPERLYFFNENILTVSIKPNTGKKLADLTDGKVCIYVVLVK